MIDISKIYNTNNSGTLRIITYLNSLNVTVEFVDTGYTKTTTADCIIKGKVKDLLIPSVFGVGYIGDGDRKPRVNRKTSKEYVCWKNMLERCYSEKRQERAPTYIGCSVVKEWHDFQVFAIWYDKNNIEGYELDKDIKFKGNKVYGPETCIFVTRKDNVTHSHAKEFRFKSPKGTIENIYNLSAFCVNRGLDVGNMHKVHKGVYSQHKGWTKA